MNITFDPVKDASNIAKHGVSLSLATSLDWGSALVWIDVRFAYDELRQCALSPLGAHLYHVAFVDREDDRRIISLRRANRREVKRYVSHY